MLANHDAAAKTAITRAAFADEQRRLDALTAQHDALRTAVAAVHERARRAALAVAQLEAEESRMLCLRRAREADFERERGRLAALRRPRMELEQEAAVTAAECQTAMSALVARVTSVVGGAVSAMRDAAHAPEWRQALLERRGECDAAQAAVDALELQLAAAEVGLVALVAAADEADANAAVAASKAAADDVAAVAAAQAAAAVTADSAPTDADAAAAAAGPDSRHTERDALQQLASELKADSLRHAAAEAAAAQRRDALRAEVRELTRRSEEADRALQAAQQVHGAAADDVAGVVCRACGVRTLAVEECGHDGSQS